jgi:Protein of unknown function (DUF3305)
MREAIEVGIIVERRTLKSPWADFAWLPVAVIPGVPATQPWTILETNQAVTRYYAGSLELELFTTDTAMYRDNLATGAPKLWVVLSETDSELGVALHSVTPDPSEGEAATEPGSVIVEQVPMPAEIAQRIAAFVDAHHVEQVFFKRKRDRSDPEALAFTPKARPEKKP